MGWLSEPQQSQGQQAAADAAARAELESSQHRRAAEDLRQRGEAEIQRLLGRNTVAPQH